MSITVSVGGTPISNTVIFTEMGPWWASCKTMTHTPDGANYDIIYHTGNHSRSTTVNGYCKRTAANIAELERMNIGNKITIVHSVEGTRTGIVTALQPKVTAGGLFITFSMTVVEQ